MSWLEQARQFLQISPQFQLGYLPTEQPHPLTINLSEMAKKDLPGAIELLLEVERSAVNVLFSETEKINELLESAQSTLKSGHRVFFCGCGATGRLSLSIETFWRELVLSQAHDPKLLEQVISFMAGGDYALVHSIENFEDFPEYGARQLRDLDFRDGDLLISTTEGGETPFVIGATLEAARISKRAPYFLYCNPDHVLLEKLERCREVLTHSHIKKISLPIGPMAICGSTRLQATTVLMLAAGSALLYALTGRDPKDEIKDFLNRLNPGDFLGLQPLIVRESAYYQKNERLLHAASDYAITVLTDLTERSPTFSLSGFENYYFLQQQQLLASTEVTGSARPPTAWTYLWVPNAQSSLESWHCVLRREPRCLDWDGFSERYGKAAALGFDFSERGHEFRLREQNGKDLKVFSVERQSERISFKHEELTHSLPRPESLLIEHLVVKIGLNISSNLVMSRLDRVHGNLMLWVRASNNKLIDRAIRYVQILFQNSGEPDRFTYEQIAYELFKTRENLPANEPAVLRTYENLKKLI